MPREGHHITINFGILESLGVGVNEILGARAMQDDSIVLIYVGSHSLDKQNLVVPGILVYDFLEC